jgi:hypothetical protein
MGDLYNNPTYLNEINSSGYSILIKEKRGIVIIKHLYNIIVYI